jgi:hypothetical protein
VCIFFLMKDEFNISLKKLNSELKILSFIYSYLCAK